MQRILILIVLLAVLGCGDGVTIDGTQTMTRFYIHNDTTFTVRIVSVSEGDTLFNDSIPPGEKLFIGLTDPVSGGSMPFFQGDSVYIMGDSGILQVYTAYFQKERENILNFSDYTMIRVDEYLVDAVFYLFKLSE